MIKTARSVWGTVRAGRATAALFGYFALGTVLLVIFLPIYWLIITSLKHQNEFFTQPVIFFPSSVTLDHYRAALADPMNRSYLANTVIVTLVVTPLATMIGMTAAYALACVRLPFKLNRILLIWILLNRLFPAVSLIIPYYVIIRNLGLLDTQAALIITDTATAVPFVVWLMTTFFQELPKDLERAAVMDGCNLYQRFLLVIAPLSVASVTVTAIFVFMGVWNELLYAAALTTLRARTIPVAIAGFVGDNALAWGEMSALSVISFVPILALSLAVQRYLVRGLTFGAIKE